MGSLWIVLTDILRLVEAGRHLLFISELVYEYVHSFIYSFDFHEQLKQLHTSSLCASLIAILEPSKVSVQNVP